MYMEFIYLVIIKTSFVFFDNASRPYEIYL